MGAIVSTDIQLLPGLLRVSDPHQSARPVKPRRQIILVQRDHFVGFLQRLAVVAFVQVNSRQQIAGQYEIRTDLDRGLQLQARLFHIVLGQ